MWPDAPAGLRDRRSGSLLPRAPRPPFEGPPTTPRRAPRRPSNCPSSLPPRQASERSSSRRLAALPGSGNSEPRRGRRRSPETPGDALKRSPSDPSTALKRPVGFHKTDPASRCAGGSQRDSRQPLRGSRTSMSGPITAHAATTPSAGPAMTPRRGPRLPERAEHLHRAPATTSSRAPPSRRAAATGGPRRRSEIVLARGRGRRRAWEPWTTTLTGGTWPIPSRALHGDPGASTRRGGRDRCSRSAGQQQDDDDDEQDR